MKNKTKTVGKPFQFGKVLPPIHTTPQMASDMKRIADQYCGGNLSQMRRYAYEMYIAFWETTPFRRAEIKKILQK